MKLNASIMALLAGFATFWGLARPPTSYGAYAGDNKDAAKCVATSATGCFSCLCPGSHPRADLACMRRYAFEYPAGWKVETVGKVSSKVAIVQCCLRSAADGRSKSVSCFKQNEKGMQGIDSRVRNTRIKGEAQCYLSVLAQCS